MTNGNEPAFPVVVSTTIEALGLSKREYYAAIMLQAILQTDKHTAKVTGQKWHTTNEAVEWADALIVSLRRSK